MSFTSFLQACIASFAEERKKLSVQVVSVSPGGAGDVERSGEPSTQPDDGLSQPPPLPEVGDSVISLFMIILVF